MGGKKKESGAKSEVVDSGADEEFLSEIRFVLENAALESANNQILDEVRGADLREAADDWWHRNGVPSIEGRYSNAPYDEAMEAIDKHALDAIFLDTYIRCTKALLAGKPSLKPKYKLRRKKASTTSTAPKLNNKVPKKTLDLWSMIAKEALPREMRKPAVLAENVAALTAGAKLPKKVFNLMLEALGHFKSRSPVKQALQLTQLYPNEASVAAVAANGLGSLAKSTQGSSAPTSQKNYSQDLDSLRALAAQWPKVLCIQQALAEVLARAKNSDHSEELRTLHKRIPKDSELLSHFIGALAKHAQTFTGAKRTNAWSQVAKLAEAHPEKDEVQRHWSFALHDSRRQAIEAGDLSFATLQKKRLDRIADVNSEARGTIAYTLNTHASMARDAKKLQLCRQLTADLRELYGRFPNDETVKSALVKSSGLAFECAMRLKNREAAREEILALRELDDQIRGVGSRLRTAEARAAKAKIRLPKGPASPTGMDYFSLETLGDLQNSELCFARGTPEGMVGYRVTSGTRAKRYWPENARMYMPSDSGSKTPGLLGNTNSSLLLSAKGVELVKEFCKDIKIEYFPFDLYNHKKKLVSSDYWCVNVLGTVDCLNLKASGVTYHESGEVWAIEEYIVEPSKMKTAPHLFRIAEKPLKHIMSRALKEAFKEAKITNISGIKLKFR